MNFVQFLKSLDEFLYEVMTWLVFYPITMWRTLRHPWAMMRYADTELSDHDDQQYTDTLSPPIFLIATLLLSHAVELALVGDDPLVNDTHGLAGLIRDDTSLLLMRLVTFSIFPLIMAVNLVRKQQIGLDRRTLKAPFYSQCYVTAPFALLLGLSATISRLPHDWAAAVSVALLATALFCYGLLQSGWFAEHLHISRLRGFGTASVAMIECLVFMVIVAPLLS